MPHTAVSTTIINKLILLYYVLQKITPFFKLFRITKTDIHTFCAFPAETAGRKISYNKMQNKAGQQPCKAINL